MEMKNLCGEGQQENLHRLLYEFFRPPGSQRPLELEIDRQQAPQPQIKSEDQF